MKFNLVLLTAVNLVSVGRLCGMKDSTSEGSSLSDTSSNLSDLNYFELSEKTKKELEDKVQEDVEWWKNQGKEKDIKEYKNDTTVQELINQLDIAIQNNNIEKTKQIIDQILKVEISTEELKIIFDINPHSNDASKLFIELLSNNELNIAPLPLIQDLKIDDNFLKINTDVSTVSDLSDLSDNEDEIVGKETKATLEAKINFWKEEYCLEKETRYQNVYAQNEDISFWPKKKIKEIIKSKMNKNENEIISEQTKINIEDEINFWKNWGKKATAPKPIALDKQKVLRLKINDDSDEGSDLTDSWEEKDLTDNDDNNDDNNDQTTESKTVERGKNNCLIS